MDDAYSLYGSLPLTTGTARQHSFLHLAIPSYGSLYYCYLLSQALAVDLLTGIQNSGDTMNKDAVRRYRTSVLERGSSGDAKEMISEFLGREYNLEAYRRWVMEGKKWSVNRD